MDGTFYQNAITQCLTDIYVISMCKIIIFILTVCHEQYATSEFCWLAESLLISEMSSVYLHGAHFLQC